MKKLVYLFLYILCFSLQAQVHVKGYYRKDGTYVQPYIRSNPDGNPYNNWSFPGNINPYTGKVASGNPDTYLEHYYDRTSDSYGLFKGNTSDASSLLNISEANHFVCVKVKKLNVRFSPSVKSSIVKTLTYGDKLEFMEEVKDWNTVSKWYKVSITDFNGQIAGFGYILSNYASKGSYSDLDLPFHVTTNVLNVRSGPATYYPVISTLSFGHKITVDRVYDNWFRINLEYYDYLSDSWKNTYGFVNRKYLSQ